MLASPPAPWPFERAIWRRPAKDKGKDHRDKRSLREEVTGKRKAAEEFRCSSKGNYGSHRITWHRGGTREGPRRAIGRNETRDLEGCRGIIEEVVEGKAQILMVGGARRVQVDIRKPRTDVAVEPVEVLPHDFVKVSLHAQ